MLLTMEKLEGACVFWLRYDDILFMPREPIGP